MWINTKSIFEWDKNLKQYVEVHNEGFEYSGEMALTQNTDIDCSWDGWCPPGLVCEDGNCVPESGYCWSNTDCPQGTSCQGGICVSIQGGGGGCQNHNDCGWGQSCVNGNCVDIYDEESAICDDPQAINYGNVGECAYGEGGGDDPEQFLCPNGNADCPDGWHCNPSTGGCEFGDTPQCLDPTASGEDEYGNCIYDDDGDMYGCMDSSATNYDPSATIDDGSCVYGGDEEGVLGCTDSLATNWDENATVDNDSCDYAYYAELNAYNCNPGEMYIDSDSGMLNYCPGGGGALGDPLSEYRGGGDTWGETTGLTDVEGEMDLYDVFGGQRNIFDVLPENVLRTLPPQYWSMVGGTYDISQEIPSWETFGGNVRGLQSGTRTERRNIQEALRGMNLGGGVSQTFAGGGGGVMPGREKTGAMASFQDFLSGQSADLAGYELGFGEDVTGMRQNWEDLVSGGYANILAGGATQYCNCAPGYVCVGMIEGEEQCVFEGDVDWQQMQNIYNDPELTYTT